ncbi:hypothetical protein ACFSUS_18220 [Spirosoma soli]|uniref:Uncharacterized protein n=1 Tax=Spirosoma soli TaxID=1770529 RepID=A0ABW5M7W5_9BACT
MLLLLLVTPINRSRVFWISSSVALLFCISSYVIYTPRLELMQREAKAGVYNWTHNRYWMIYRTGCYYNTVSDTLSGWAERHAAKWYSFPMYIHTLSASALRYKAHDTSIQATVRSYPTHEELTIDYPNSSRIKGEPYGVLVSREKVWLFKGQHPTSWHSLLSKGHYQIPAVFCKIPLHLGLSPDIPTGKYQVGIVLLDDDRITYAALKPGLTVDVQPNGKGK